MFYIPEILTKRGKLSYCWLAGTLDERMFKSKVSAKKILEIDISATCDAIIRVLNVRSEDHRVRFSLYLSSRLMCGVVKLYLYQLNLFEKTLSITQYNLQPVKVGGGKKKKKAIQKDPKTITLEDNLNVSADYVPEPPPVDFGEISWRDVNLMAEVSPESLRRNRQAIEAVLPYFPPLTEDEVETWSNVDFVEKDSDVRQVSVRPPHEDDSVPPVDVSSFNVRVPGLEEPTGHKRRSSDVIDIRPAKRRRTLGPEVDSMSKERAEELPSISLPDQEESAGAIAHPLLSIQEEEDALPLMEAASIPTAEPLTVPVSALSVPPTEALPVSVPEAPPIPAEVSERPKTTKKRRGKIIDKNLQIPRTASRRQPHRDLQARTIRQSDVLAKPEQTCVVRVSRMLHYPSTTFNYYPDRIPIVRQRIYCNELIEDFENAISAPFVVETEYSEIIEFVRQKKNETLAAVSTFADKTGPEASKSKEETAPEMIDTDNAGPVQVEAQVAGTSHDTGLEATGDVLPPLPRIPAEQELEDSEAQAPEQQQPQIVDQQVDQPLDQQLDQPIEHFDNGEVIENVNGSDPDTQNLDAFLPECLKGRDKTTKISQEKRRTDAIIDIASSVTSERSDVSTVSVWPINDFLGSLEVLWHDRPVLPFKVLYPPETTRRVEAAGSLNLLLELRKQKKVFLEQSDQIYITKAW